MRHRQIGDVPARGDRGRRGPHGSHQLVRRGVLHDVGHRAAGLVRDHAANVGTLREHRGGPHQYHARRQHRCAEREGVDREDQASPQTIDQWAAGERKGRADERGPKGDLAEGDQTVWLLPYWMGRYHRLIE